MDTRKLTTQQGMEEVFNEYCNNWVEDQVGRVNELCKPQFVSCDFESKKVRLSYYVQDWMRNSWDVMHGGIVSTVFDLTMGLLSRYCSGGELTPTTNMQVTYLRPIPALKTLIIEAECTMTGKTMCAISARSWVDGREEKLTATATGTYYTGKNNVGK